MPPLDKRLTQDSSILIYMTDSANRVLLHELQESRSVVARLSAQCERSTGWEARLCILEQERDDINEERKAQSVRDRAAERRRLHRLRSRRLENEIQSPKPTKRVRLEEWLGDMGPASEVDSVQSAQPSNTSSYQGPPTSVFSPTTLQQLPSPPVERIRLFLTLLEQGHLTVHTTITKSIDDITLHHKDQERKNILYIG